MTDKAIALFREGKITQYDYDTYILFGLEEIGRNYLKNKIESIFMEEPNVQDAQGYAWLDGKRAEWRDIKKTVQFVELLIKGYREDV